MNMVQAFKLTDTDWVKITQVSNLPADARSAVEQAIALFQAFEASGEYTAYQTKLALRAVRKRTVELHQELLKVMGNSEAHFALTAPVESRDSATRFPAMRIDAHRRLERTLQTIKEFASWLLLAHSRVQPMRSGASRRAGDVLWLVGSLDVVWIEFTGRSITRSKKRTDPSREYITTVCQIADPTMTSGTIEHAMQEHIRARRNSR